MSDTISPDSKSQAAWLNDDFSYDEARNLWSMRSAGGEFGYSDGDENEEYLLATLKAASDRSVMSSELSAGMKDWPSTYHLHHQRCNVFRAITHFLKGPVLEIGAGCGVLTRYLGEQGNPVYALEGSPRRSSIIGERCRDLDNVEVINANFQDFRPAIKFKTITLIGVLEYARVYFSDGSASDPIDQMLRAVSEMLEPDGVLIVAIENKLGLKYFAGYAEDHFGKPMFGIEDRYDDDTVVTFGRAQLAGRMRSAGLENIEFAYPFPDYKFPQAVLFERAITTQYATSLAPLVAAANDSDRQKPGSQHFSMSGAVKSVMENGLGGELANSFIAIASKSDVGVPNPDGDVLAVHFGTGNRKNAYLKKVIFQPSGAGMRVTRSHMTDDRPRNDDTFQLVLEEEEFSEGQLWTDALQKLLLDENWQIGDLRGWAETWIGALLQESNFATDQIPNKHHSVASHLFDALPKNLVVALDGTAKFIDLEWRSSASIEFGYLFYRGVSDSLKALQIVEHRSQPVEIGELVIDVGAEIGLDLNREDIDRYIKREEDFQRSISRANVQEAQFTFLNTRPGERAYRRLIRKHRKRLRRKFKLSQTFIGSLWRR